MTAPDLLSLLLTLRPLPEACQAPVPDWWGRAAHALLLEVVRRADPPLAARLHEDNGGPRPFTASTLLGRFPRREGLPYLDPGQSYTLRLTALEAGLAELVFQAAQNGPLVPGAPVELDHLPFRVEKAEPLSLAPSDVEDQGHPWAGSDSYQELSAAYLLARIQPPRRIALLLASPTTFKSGGMHVPYPSPELAFGSLLERWNAFAPITFPPEARRYAAECLAVGRYRLSTHTVPLKGGGLRVGAVGQVVYVTLNYDRYWMSVIATLAGFARYAGLGAGTAMGLGQCRQVQAAQEAG